MTLYSLLNVKEDASLDEILSAFKKKSSEIFIDKIDISIRILKLQSRLNEALFILGDLRKRIDYDRNLSLSRKVFYSKNEQTLDEFENPIIRLKSHYLSYDKGQDEETKKLLEDLIVFYVKTLADENEMSFQFEVLDLINQFEILLGREFNKEVKLSKENNNNLKK